MLKISNIATGNPDLGLVDIFKYFEQVNIINYYTSFSEGPIPSIS